MNFICSCTIGATTAAASSSIDRERERERGGRSINQHTRVLKSCFNTCRVDLLAPHSHSRGWQSLHREVSWFTISHLRPPRSLCVYILECCLRVGLFHTMLSVNGHPSRPKVNLLLLLLHMFNAHPRYARAVYSHATTLAPRCTCIVLD